MRIIELRAENIKRLERGWKSGPDGAIVEIAGKNSRARPDPRRHLRALAGTKNIQAEPIRDAPKAR